MAGSSAHCHFCAYTGFDEETGEYWVYLEVNEGAYGGRYGKDGPDSVDTLIPNTRNNPIEELEWRFPMRCERYELRDEPAAPGQWRGGIGIVRENRFLVDGFFGCEGTRQLEEDPPRGMFGGVNGLVGSLTRNPGTAGEEAINAMVSGVPIHAGDLFQIVAPSGGGFGNPLERDPCRCARTCSTASRRSSRPVTPTGSSSTGRRWRSTWPRRSRCASTKRATRATGCRG